MTQETNYVDVDDAIIPSILGVKDDNLRYIETFFQSKLTVRGGKIAIQGTHEEFEKIKRVFIDLEALFRSRKKASRDDIAVILRLAGFTGEVNQKSTVVGKSVVIDTPRGIIRPRGDNQTHYVKMMEKQSIVFSLGPAGTGKTYLAVAMAVDKLQRRYVEKIILTRPVVESGESLGFLPGDIQEKVDPYFRPLYDALDDMLTRERVRRFIDRGVIEIAPLAYMRGRTLNNAFVILDEAQNTTSGQMKMFLTRLGPMSRAVLTGDLTQIDLQDKRTSGLLEANELLQGIDGIGFVEFTDKDVVRHRLVADILRAYQGEDSEK